MATEASSRPTGFARALFVVLAVTLASLLLVYIYTAQPANDSGAAPEPMQMPLPDSSASQPDSAALTITVDTSNDRVHANSSANDNTETPGSAAAPPPRTLRELLQRASENTPRAPMEEVLANTRDVSLVNGAYDIVENGVTHRLPLTEKQQALRLRIADNGVMAGDADPVVRFTGPSGRWVVDAHTRDGEVMVELPAKTLQAGIYIMDVNPQQPRSSKQRRYILQLGNERVNISPADEQLPTR